MQAAWGDELDEQADAMGEQGEYAGGQQQPFVRDRTLRQTQTLVTRGASVENGRSEAG